MYETNLDHYSNKELFYKDQYLEVISKDNLKTFFNHSPCKIKKISKIFVKDVGENTKNYINFGENFVGCYREYEIFIIDENNNISIKCYSRYSDFDLFCEKLKRNYPFAVIIEMPPKNPLTRVKIVDDFFFKIRERRLEIFLNYIYDNFGSNSIELIKFLNDSELDHCYFNEIYNKNIFIENDKIDIKFKSKIGGLFNYFTNYSSYQRLISKEEIRLIQYRKFYADLFQYYQTLKFNTV